MSESVQDRVNQCIIESVAPFKAFDDADRLIEDMGADSLDLVELVMDLEEEFRLDIYDDMWEQHYHTPKSIADMISELI